MDKVFHFDSPRDHYHADACVIACYDARFDLVVRKFLKYYGIATYDMVKIPGSAKALASPDSEAVRDFVVRMVRISQSLHSATRVFLIGHNDCGAYGGAPAETIIADLFRAAVVLRGAEPSMAVECYFADFDGIYQCGPAPAVTIAP
ncbi:MAG TPA: carbonic anhydrase [Bryobacteraceae bacterium]|nr:carbonic anhydrase [Bryobacteraceae bacterium]